MPSFACLQKLTRSCHGEFYLPKFRQKVQLFLRFLFQSGSIQDWRALCYVNSQGPKIVHPLCLSCTDRGGAWVFFISRLPSVPCRAEQQNVGSLFPSCFKPALLLIMDSVAMRPWACMITGRCGCIVEMVKHAALSDSLVDRSILGRFTKSEKVLCRVLLKPAALSYQCNRYPFNPPCLLDFVIFVICIPLISPQKSNHLFWSSSGATKHAHNSKSW